MLHKRKKTPPSRSDAPLAIASQEAYSCTDEAVAIITREGEIIGVRRAGMLLPSSAADVQEDGSLSYELTGSPPQGEADAIDICKRLVRKLNSDGGKWGEPVRPAGREEGVDGEARDGQGILKIQVTRVDATFWESMRYKQAHREVTPDEAADVVRTAIERKTKTDHKDIVLALDSSHTAALVFRRVVECFRRQHGLWAQELKFRQIWLVGPSDDLVERLDRLL